MQSKPSIKMPPEFEGRIFATQAQRQYYARFAKEKPIVLQAYYSLLRNLVIDYVTKGGYFCRRFVNVDGECTCTEYYKGYNLTDKEPINYLFKRNK